MESNFKGTNKVLLECLPLQRLLLCTSENIKYHILDLPQVDLFFILDLFISVERSENVFSSDEITGESVSNGELLERTFRLLESLIICLKCGERYKI